MENRSFNKIVTKEKHRFVQYAAVAIGSVFFLVGTLVLSLSDDNQKLESLRAAGVINFIGGLIYSVSIYSFFMKEKYQGNSGPMQDTRNFRQRWTSPLLKSIDV